jgi:hypothetical protein
MAVIWNVLIPLCQQHIGTIYKEEYDKTMVRCPNWAVKAWVSLWHYQNHQSKPIACSVFANACVAIAKVRASKHSPAIATMKAKHQPQ